MFLRQCRQSFSRWKVADTGGTKLTGGRLLIGALIFERLLRRKGIADGAQAVGIMLPPSVGGVVANITVALLRKVAVNLNYTLSNDDVNFCINEAGITHVLTSRKFMEKMPFDLDAEVILLEDLKGKATKFDKLWALFQAYAWPVTWLERKLRLHEIGLDDVLTIIFTSGSTGEPKGVVLTHNNILSNTLAVNETVRIDEKDVLLGVLPFFHSFGYTGCLWLTMALDPATAYHFNPLDGRQIGKLCEKYGVSIILAAPTFLRTYLKRCEVKEMKQLDLVIVGAEKMPLDLAEAFEQKFGVMPTEGYGTTELSPVVAVNVPEQRSRSGDKNAVKLGTVGRPLPRISAKIVDPDTLEDLGIGAEGMLLVKGPNVMKGYLNQPEKTAEVLRDGWYNTGDIGKIHEDGFIEITGRQSRFSKIGGEMVPHIKLEQILTQIVRDPDDDEPEIKIAVTSVPDDKKGERLVVVHKRGIMSPDAIRQKLRDYKLPNLWVPSRDSFLQVDEIPMLGTGKLDLRGLKNVAMEKFCPAEAQAADA